MSLQQVCSAKCTGVCSGVTLLCVCSATVRRHLPVQHGAVQMSGGRRGVRVSRLVSSQELSPEL